MLTQSQLTQLKAYIDATPALSSLPMTADGHVAAAAILNSVASPDFWVWRTSVSRDELVGSVSVDGTVFNWTGTGFITRSQGEREAFAQMFDAAGRCNPAMSNVRQAFLDIFSGGTAPAPANRAHLSAVSRRKATTAEKLFATGTGSTASPATMSFEGHVSPGDVDAARNS